MVNTLVLLKGALASADLTPCPEMLYALVPSLATTFTTKAPGDYTGRLDTFCLDTEGPIIVLNMFRVVDEEALAAYTSPASLQFFPLVGARALLAATLRAEAWDILFLNQFASKAAFCSMVSRGREGGGSCDPQALSTEYTAIIPHKTRALADAHTYATRPFALDS